MFLAHLTMSPESTSLSVKEAEVLICPVVPPLCQRQSDCWGQRGGGLGASPSRPHLPPPPAFQRPGPRPSLPGAAMIVFTPAKFAFFFTFGNVFLPAGTMFLVGPMRHPEPGPVGGILSKITSNVSFFCLFPVRFFFAFF